MKLKAIVILYAAALVLTACHKTGESTSNTDTDTVAVKPDCIADTALTNTAQYYADKVDTHKAYERMAKVDSLLSHDMSDLQKNCNYAFYPFGGPDFIFPHHIFPNADTYFLMGLEEHGTVATEPDHSKINAYTFALRNYVARSYYITAHMHDDLSEKGVDGTLPIITMLMVKDGCKIISVKEKNFDAKGNIVDATGESSLAEVKFFSTKTPKHEQTLYYYTGNTKDSKIDTCLTAYLDKTLPRYKVATFLKAASYLLYGNSFSRIRNYILDNSFAVLQDDSGMRYKNFKQGWDVTIYGEYVVPISDFPATYFQHDLDSLYKSQKGHVRPLDFRIGYDWRSNWMCARKQK